MRRLAFVLASSAMIVAPVAQAAAQTSACLTPRELTALSTYALPGVVSALSQRCGPTLGADSYLRTDGARLSERLATQRSAAWPVAKSAFLRLAQAQSPQTAQVLTDLPDATLQPLADSFLQAAIAQRVPTDRCAPIDRMLRLLSPLPAASASELIAIAVGLTARGGRGRIGNIPVCEA